MAIEIAFLDHRAPSWAKEIDHLRGRLGAPDNRLLFPPQFLQAVLPKIGGRVALFREAGSLRGAGVLFPRSLQAGRPVYTLRFHRADPGFRPDPAPLTTRVEAALDGAGVVFYDPQVERAYAGTSQGTGPVEIGRPSSAEAKAIPALQQQIWRSAPDYLYPPDIHAPAFGAATSLVARYDNHLVGCLFGFYRFGGGPLPAGWARAQDLRIESQLLGVLPAYRGHSIGFLLKKRQAEVALEAGDEIVHWTADPLQYTNAVLNFGKLRAVAFSFFPDYYPYRNVLNRVPASRLEITWPVGSRRVREVLAGTAAKTARSLPEEEATVVVNEGGQIRRLETDAPTIAVEIPTDWTRLQQEELETARRWRQATDRLLQHYLGADRYAVTGVGQAGDRRYLIAERPGPDWEG